MLARYYCAAYFWKLDPDLVLGKTLFELQGLEEGAEDVNAALARVNKG